MKLTLRALVAGIAVLASGACVPTLSSVGVEVSYVRTAPPPPRYEVVTVSPGPGYAWIEGFWVWQSDRYYWTPGHWERAPRPRAHWEHGRWRKHDRGWYWVPGHWR